jgi:ring-1,2-phenylacetyl-CoA epoxidase subunit PaaC
VKEKLYQYLLMLGDNSMILGHRLSELCGHGPSLETDIALTNHSLDLFGQVRSYFQYAAEVKGGEATEDSVAFLRYERDYLNTILVEQPNTDFAHVIGRQFLFDAYHLPLLEQLMESNDETIAAIAAKSIKESRYHLRFSSSWVKRLGDGTEESHQRMQAAMNHLFPFVHELFRETPIEKEMKELGIGADLSLIKERFDEKIKEVFAEATLEIPQIPSRQVNGKIGIHTEQMGFILAELQYMQRAYPNMTW